MDKSYTASNYNATLKKCLRSHDTLNKQTEHDFSSDKVFNMAPALRKSTRIKKITPEETDSHLKNCIYKFDKGESTEIKDLTSVSNKRCDYINEFEEIDSMKNILDKFEARTVFDYKNQILKLHQRPIFQESMQNYLSKMIDDSDENKNNDETDNIKKYTGYYSEFFGVQAPLVYYHDLDGDIYEAQYCQTGEDVSVQQNVDVDKLIKGFETGTIFNSNKNEEKTQTEDKIQTIFEEVNKIREENQRIFDTKICENEQNEEFDLDIILPPPIQFQTSDSSSTIYVSSSPGPSLSSISSSVLGSTNETKAEPNRSPEQFDCNASEPEGGGRGHEEMGSNLSKRRSQSSGNLNANNKLEDKYKLCGSLPNHLDLPSDNNNESSQNKRAADDPGYGSERSGEEDPPFPACPVHHAHFINKYPFINSGSVFSVSVKKGSGGLGLSVSGGEPWPGLVRIKRLFPHQPASHSGQLQPGDILLAASGVPLLGLSNYEALEVLRSAPAEVKLTVCRPPEAVLPPVETNPPPPPPREQPSLPPPSQYGEFEIVMEKMNGSLGFTLRKEDQSVLGHYVRALVREPALSDPRIRPGDKIVAVNDVDMSSLSHEEAVSYLRQCGSLVRLRLYRDQAQTPLQPHSPTHSHHRTFKPILRKEAQDMLSELAVKKCQSSQDSSGSSKGSSPRKRRLTRTPPPPDSVECVSADSMEDVKPGRPEQLGVTITSPHNPNYHYTTSLATQSSEEELVGGGLSGAEPPPSEPVSMPPLGTSPALDQQQMGFSYRNPAYRSANPPPSKPLVPQEINETGCSEQDIPSVVDGTKSLLKWKGVIFPPEEDERREEPERERCSLAESIDGSLGSCSESSHVPPEQPPEYQVVIVELNRGWNSRLGFSVQASSDGGSLISAIYPDSVASRDGRLRIGDRIINVNDEGIENMDTSDVIDLLRKIRGSISLTLLRKRN